MKALVSAKVGRWAALTYGMATAVVVIFEMALAAGAPWGEFTMGGTWPGRLPPALRLGAVVQALMLAAMAGVVLARSGGAPARWARQSRWMIWIVVAVAALSLALNLMTPSAAERAAWAPVAFVMLATSLIVASSPAHARARPTRRP